MSAIAISGEATAITAERSARFSSTNCMLGLLFGDGCSVSAPPISNPSFSRVASAAFERRRQPAVEHHRDAIGNLGQFVEILADDQHRGAAAGEIDQRLANDRRRTGIDAPGRLTDDRTPGSRRISRPTMNFCRLPPERLTASGSRLALRTSNVLVVRSTTASVAGLSTKPRS